MSVTDAEKFVELIESDPVFRVEFQEAESWEEASVLVKAAGLDFTEAEFETIVLSRAQAADAAGDAGSPLLRAHW